MSREALRSAAASEVDRWERLVADELLRLFDRQEAVVLARLQGTKARKHTRHWEPPGIRPLEVKGIIDPARWVKDAAGSLAPLLTRLFTGVHKRVAQQFDPAADVAAAQEQLGKAVEERLDLVAVGVRTAVEEVETFIAAEEDAGTAMPVLVKRLRELYDQRKPGWADRIATVNVVGSINQAAMYAADEAGSSAKQWLSRRDSKVRDTHVKADGQVRLLDEPFRLGGFDGHAKSRLMFPGDPSAPLDEVINCRCTLLFSPPRKADVPLEDKARGSASVPFSGGSGGSSGQRYVRTAAGAAQYGQAINTPIVADPRAPAGPRKSFGKIAGLDVQLGGKEADVRAAIAQHAGASSPPDPATTEVLVLRDGKGRVSAYAVWQIVDGPQPKGSIVAVSVHPSLRGQRIGDQMVAFIAKADPDVKPQTRPAVGAAPARGASAPVAPARAGRVIVQLDANGLPVITDRSKPGDQPGTSGVFDDDAARIDRLQKAYLRDKADTTSLFSRGGRWTRERELQQQAIIDHFLTAPGVKADRKALVIGGLPGAGKTTAINSPAGQQALGVDLSEYVTVNADEVKAEMIARGMVPDYPGLTADESATLFHAESFEVAHSLMRQAAKRDLNIAYDTSLKSAGQLGFVTSAGSRTAPPPYRTTLLFVDVPTSVAKQRARDRYLAGGRYMPLALIDGMRGRSARSSGPREQFDAVKRSVDRFVLVDNTGAAPVVVDSGGGRSTRPAAGRVSAPASAAPQKPAAARTAPPAPAPVAAAPPPVATPTVPPPQLRAVPAATLNPALPPPPQGAKVYTHPQGKTIYVHPNGSLEVFKPDGKRGTSSATAAKLAAGHGGWSLFGAAPTAPAAAPAPRPSSAPAPQIVAAPAAPLQQSAGLPAPAGALPVVPMDFSEAELSEVPKAIADPNIVFQQKVDGIRGVLVLEPGKAPWFAGKKGDRLVSSTAAKTTAPMLAALPATVDATMPPVRIEGEVLNGKFHVFDMVVLGQETLPYEQRQAMAEAWANASGLPQAVPLPVAKTSAEKQALWDAVLASGAEGVMMKRRDSPYNGGARVDHTRKAKITATADVVVLSVGVGGKANAEMGLRIGGRTQSIGTVSTNGKGAIAVGDVVEVEYLWAMPTGTLTQPRIVRVRKDKTAADVTDASQLRVVDKTVLAVKSGLGWELVL